MKRQGFPVSAGSLTLATLTTVMGTIVAGTTAPIGYPAIVRRTADTAARNNSNTGSTLTNDDAAGGTLQFAIGASATEVYWVEAYLRWSPANTTMDIKIGWNATGLPAGATANWGTAAGAVQPNFGSIATGTTGTALNAIGATAANGSGPASEGLSTWGWFFGGGTAGNITFAWAQNTADPGNLILQANSFLRVTKLAA